MKRTILILMLGILMTGFAEAQSARNLITANSAGNVKLGMTVAHVRKAVAPMKLSRTSDGEGIALILVKRGNVDVMTLYASEEDRNAKINENARIEQIWVLDKSYRTAKGVYPGMMLAAAEKLYGKVKAVTMSEIEARETAEFTDHPSGIDFRVRGKDGSAGDYPQGARTASTYKPGAYVFAVTVTGRNGSTTGIDSDFSSEYTDLKTGCKTSGGNEGGHVSHFCKGPGDYQIHYFDAATVYQINAATNDRKWEEPLQMIGLDKLDAVGSVEWRLASGKPFAVLVRKPGTDTVIVRGLKGFDRIKYEESGNGAMNRARSKADSDYEDIIGKEQTLEAIAAPFLPTGAKPLHDILKGNFGGSTGNIVVLHGKEAPAVTYDGFVLVPKGSQFEKFDLPRPEYTWSIEEPMGVFFANADSDRELELFIIGECYTGIGPTGARPFYRTRVYDRQGGRFVHLENVSSEVGTLRTAAVIRRQLPAIVRRAEARFVTMDVDVLNKKLDDSQSAKTPLQIISFLVDPFSEMLARSVSIKAATVEEPESLAIVVTDDGYADDSVRGEQYKFKLTRNVAGDWRVSTASKGWRCQPGRGPQTFSSKLCI